MSYGFNPLRPVNSLYGKIAHKYLRTAEFHQNNLHIYAPYGEQTHKCRIIHIKSRLEQAKYNLNLIR
jgi:hypothetical protein